VSGSVSAEIDGESCSGIVTGTATRTVTFSGIESISVPAGTFNACRFEIDQMSNTRFTCGSDADEETTEERLTQWFVDGLGLVRTFDRRIGVTSELLTYTAPAP
jgi:hypothetical protein